MSIWLKVDTRSGVPLYLQLVEQIKHAVEIGTLVAGDELPTVRQLVSDLTIAPNTVVKAYKELQDAGIIESRPGRGTIVTGQLNAFGRQQRIDEVLGHLRDAVRDAAGLSLEQAALDESYQAAVEQFYRLKKGNKTREVGT